MQNTLYLTDKTLLGIGWAVFSEDRRYRYVLGRRWDQDLPMCNGIFMNPSTADHINLDPTTTRFRQRCMKLGFGGFIVTNLNAFVETVQNEIMTVADPVGVWNDNEIRTAADRCDMVLCGWGARTWSLDRAAHVRQLLKDHCPDKLRVLQLTADGHPQHPLYLPYAKQPVRWDP